MAYNTRSILRDRYNKPVPQYFNVGQDTYEVTEGTGGSQKIIVCNSLGDEVLFEGLDRIKKSLDNLVEVINNGL